MKSSEDDKKFFVSKLGFFRNLLWLEAVINLVSGGHLAYLPRTTERPVRKRGDECSDLLVRAAPQSHGRKSVVRGLHVNPDPKF